ncbi:FtsQ-type POTRA domain-containing protein [Gallaecimonas sp. GXIMD4217]|uniref:FtsQ-type POTRA domain-containing protein n=1 Tax=Gallaecimonas sp. GXIMD4217 TaxID=3131927 RepID=UPI00311ADFA7
MQSRVGWWFGVSFLGLVLAAFVAGGAWLWRTMQDEGRLPLEVVEVQGLHPHTPAEQIRAVLLERPLGSFFSLDVNEVQRRLEALPWIYQVSVRKAWPRKLQIYLVEQQAVAKWNDNRLLNLQGEIFEAPQSEQEQALARLYGQDLDAREALEGYRKLGQLLGDAGFAIQAARLSNRQSWELELGNGPRLILGREDTLRRVQRFIDSFPYVQGEQRQPAYLDLRYDTGFAVGWQEEQQDAES